MNADAYRCVERTLAADRRDPADWLVAADASEDAGFAHFLQRQANYHGRKR